MLQIIVKAYMNLTNEQAETEIYISHQLIGHKRHCANSELNDYKRLINMGWKLRNMETL
jgi:hypothetical protein